MPGDSFFKQIAFTLPVRCATLGVEHVALAKKLRERRSLQANPLWL